MNYMNPTSVPGMFNVPKDNSMPGAGYGGFQGFLEGQAARQGMDFLDMAKAQQGQEFAKNQLQNQIAWETKDAAIRKPFLENQATEANTEHQKADTDRLRTTVEQIKKANKYKNFEVAAAFAAPLAQAVQEGNQMKIRAILERYNYQAPQLVDGFKPVQWQGSPEQLQEILGDWTQAQRLIQFDKEYMQKSGLIAEEGNVKGALQSNQQNWLGGQYDKNRDTELEAARIRASAGGTGGKVTSASRMQALDEAVDPILQKVEFLDDGSADLSKLTPQERSIFIRWNTANAQAEGVRMKYSAKRQGAIEGEKAKEKVKNQLKGLDEATGGGTSSTEPGKIPDFTNKQSDIDKLPKGTKFMWGGKTYVKD